MFRMNRTTSISARGVHMLASHWLPLDVEPSCIPALHEGIVAVQQPACMQVTAEKATNQMCALGRGSPWTRNPGALAEPLSPTEGCCFLRLALLIAKTSSRVGHLWVDQPFLFYRWLSASAPYGFSPRAPD